MAASVISLLATISLVADTFKEVCSLFQITKPTLYDWIKKGKLKPIHVSSRPYFLLKDIQELLQRK
ncbi:MAG: helix-turn-helix domain-containing protein [Sphingobacteriia bacterium]|nr:helix-turn-helix domain-containing protein [Sphingobacteriia bacterium]